MKHFFLSKLSFYILLCNTTLIELFRMHVECTTLRMRNISHFLLFCLISLTLFHFHLNEILNRKTS